MNNPEWNSGEEDETTKHTTPKELNKHGKMSTYSIKEKDRLIEYVKNQEEHHKTKTFREEYIELLKEHGIEFDEKYLL